MSKPLRAGVVGAGVFGGHHARKYASLPGVELVGVFDPHDERADALAGPLGARAFDRLATLLAEVDVVTIASPASTHAEAAHAAILAGKHVYVEKPLADRAEDAWALVEAARTAGTVLACGHQERAVFAAMGLIDAPERPVRIEAVRRGTYTGRSMDVSCILDLMIHDIDLALILDPGALVAVEADGAATTGDLADHARAELRFEDGMTGMFEAWRTAPARERTMRVVFPSGEVRIDFLARTFEDTTPFRLNPDFASTPEGKDPLGASVSDFVAAIRGERPRPLVTGEEAARALEAALEVDRVAHA
jgi:predicted dehydrogenase